MKSQNYIYTTKLFDSQGIAAGGSATSDIVDIKRANGYFSIQYDIDGSGTLDILYLLSLDGVHFVTPSADAKICEGVGSGSGTSGVDIVSFNPSPARYMKLAAQETGGANPATLTLWLMVQ